MKENVFTDSGRFVGGEAVILCSILITRRPSRFHSSCFLFSFSNLEATSISTRNSQGKGKGRGGFTRGTLVSPALLLTRPATYTSHSSPANPGTGETIFFAFHFFCPNLFSNNFWTSLGKTDTFPSEVLRRCEFVGSSLCT